MWNVLAHPDFAIEIAAMDAEVRIELLAQAKLVERFGPTLGRPRVDTLKGSRYPNMKELRFDAGGGVWRVAFAFDPARAAVLLVGGDKAGGSQQRFYKTLIAIADTRLAAHLAQLAGKSPGKSKEKNR